ncbi:MAG: zinc-ribbon domain-containing protein [Candidatus Thorarchaeota archaeon]
MDSCTVGPRYCPNCGKELTPNATICIHCMHELNEKRKKASSRFEKRFTKEQIKKIRLIIGVLYLVFSLFGLCSLILAFNSSEIPSFLIPFFHSPNLLFLSLFACYTAPIGIGLTFISLNPKFKGFFLIALGYLLIFMSLFTHFSFYLFSIYISLIYLDIPILIAILFGFITINKDVRYIQNTGCFFLAFAFIALITFHGIA